MSGVDDIEIVVAHTERATLRVGDVFLKIDPDQERMDVEVEAMRLAPVPTPEILWRRPPVLALARLPGRALGSLEAPSPAPAQAWRAAGSAIRRLHDAALPPWSGRGVEDLAGRLDEECSWLLTHEVLPRDAVARGRRTAEHALRSWVPVFVHGDLQITHVFVDDDEVSGILDWSEAAPGDGLYDLATLTLAHEEHLDDVVDGYGAAVDRDLVRAWWCYRSLVAIRWLAENGYGDPADFPETRVLLTAP